MPGGYLLHPRQTDGREQRSRTEQGEQAKMETEAEGFHPVFDQNDLNGPLISNLTFQKPCHFPEALSALLGDRPSSDDSAKVPEQVHYKTWLYF